MQLYKFCNLSQFPKLFHAITTRDGGISKAPFNSLNLGYHTADHKENVKHNWEILAQSLQIDPDSFVIAHQSHSANIVVADRNTKRGAWMDPACEIENTDAFITVRKGICLVVKTADCVPVLIYDPVEHIAAVAHAGWRGTVKSVTALTVQTLINRFNVNPSNLVAGIGPSIGPCCYEIGDEVEQEAIKKWGIKNNFLNKGSNHNSLYFDLWESNRHELIQMGLKTEKIETSGICTKCNSHLYFSARATGGNTGRFCGLMMLL